MSVLNFLNLITHCGYGENVFVLKGVKGSDLCSLFSNGSEKKKNRIKDGKLCMVFIVIFLQLRLESFSKQSCKSLRLLCVGKTIGGDRSGQAWWRLLG